MKNIMVKFRKKSLSLNIYYLILYLFIVVSYNDLLPTVIKGVFGSILLIVLPILIGYSILVLIIKKEFINTF